MGTIPTDTIPLANTLQDVQDALESGADRDTILLEIIEALSDAGIQARLERILPERRSKPPPDRPSVRARR